MQPLGPLDDVDDPRPSWGVALLLGLSVAAGMALLVRLGPSGSEAREWWGLATVASGPTVLLAARFAGGAPWPEAGRVAAVSVLAFGTGMGLTLFDDAVERPPLTVLVAAVLGLVLAAAFRGRMEPPGPRPR